MKEDYEHLIAELDKNLSEARRFKEEAPVDRKNVWQKRIDDMIDRRLELMQKRDAL